MGDFAQSGLICTLQQLNDAHLPKLEVELASLTETMPITLILPCHALDLHRPALTRIVHELADAKFLREILICINGADAVSLRKARAVFACLPRHRLLSGDGSPARRLLSRLGLATTSGKGMNVWLACGVACFEREAAVVVTQDCDVASFDRSTLARLCFAAVHPELRYQFSKMFYSRGLDRLYGRVSRLFFAPLLDALARVVGTHPLIEFLASFRYPLAGECAMAREVAATLPMEPAWGLEIGLLCDVFRRVEPRRIAQVDGGCDYDHRHQPLGDEHSGLFRMCKEVARTLFSHLLEEGLPICRQFLDAVGASFTREADDALRRYRHLALINGLTATEADLEATTLFTRAFREAANEFLTGAAPVVLPAWDDLFHEQPAAARTLLQTIQLRHSKSDIRNPKQIRAVTRRPHPAPRLPMR